MNKKTKAFTTIVMFVAAIFLATGCSSSPRFHSGKQTAEKQRAAYERYSDTSAANDTSQKVLATEIGTASYYADKFDGKITYSGVVYDMNGISAAHPKYPMGTIVRITNLKNGKQIKLEINDRMPYREDRIIDLSLGAARALDMVQDGIAEVKIEVLKWGTGRK